MAQPQQGIQAAMIPYRADAGQLGEHPEAEAMQLKNMQHAMQPAPSQYQGAPFMGQPIGHPGMSPHDPAMGYPPQVAAHADGGAGGPFRPGGPPGCPPGRWMPMQRPESRSAVEMRRQRRISQQFDRLESLLYYPGQGRGDNITNPRPEISSDVLSGKKGQKGQREANLIEEAISQLQWPSERCGTLQSEVLQIKRARGIEVPAIAPAAAQAEVPGDSGAALLLDAANILGCASKTSLSEANLQVAHAQHMQQMAAAPSHAAMSAASHMQMPIIASSAAIGGVDGVFPPKVLGGFVGSSEGGGTLPL